MNEKYAEVIEGIGELIRYHLNALSNESIHPAYGDPDKMDDSIKLHRESVKELRRVRIELENIMAGMQGE